MKVCVLGLWHLGTVTAACVAAGGHHVVGLDPDPAVVLDLNSGKPPIFEPGLADLLKDGLSTGRLAFTTELRSAADADVLWVAYDTPVDHEDRADVESVMERARRVFPVLESGTLVMVSSQLPVGTTRRLEEQFANQSSGRTVMFAYSPENLRLGTAIDAFTKPDRVIVGVRSPAARVRVAQLLKPFTERIEWMSVESAEMSKHALNAFLATSVTFINEIAGLCEQVGADAAEVERALKSEARIGPKAYLSPGGAFAGGTLARDVQFLAELGREHGVATHVLSSVKSSNDRHREWAQRRLCQLLDGVSGIAVGVWGLTYKPGTDTLRRSSAIELCRWLVDHGASVRAHDPSIEALPADIAGDIMLADNPLAALDGASALVVATSWPMYREIDSAEVTARMSRCLVLDADRFTGETFGTDSRIEYFSVGKGAK
jgi:UDPglucose 6-dehydrogenase